MKSVVYEAPKGVFTRIMEGSTGYELYLNMNKGKGGKMMLDAHMTELHNTYLKQTGTKK